jgi:hypothetical protein
MSNARAGIMLILSLFICSAILAGEDETWREDFNILQLNDNRHDGWGQGNPQSVALTVKDGVVSIREIGQRSWGSAQRYISYDLEKAPYFQALLLDAPGVIGFGNASTGGGELASGVKGPCLLSLDLRQGGFARPKGDFCLSLMVVGPDGNQPGEETRIDWMRQTSGDNDHLQITHIDNQPEGQPGHGYISYGDELRVAVNTSAQYDEMNLSLTDAKTGKAIRIDGKTSFPVTFDQDRRGLSWSTTIAITGDCENSFKTWRISKGKLYPARTGVLLVADLKGGSLTRLATTLPAGVDLTSETGGAPGGGNAAKTLNQLLEGQTLLESDFDHPEKEAWRVVAGEQWSFMGGRFGDLSDSEGPDGLGNWAQAGEGWWADYSFSAEMSEEQDGAGSVFLAARFQNPKNYYALEWATAGRTDTLQIVRCKDGVRYVVAKSENHDLSKFPFIIGVSVLGDMITGTLNGQPVVTAAAGDFDAGPVALGEIGRKVLMDNVKVTRLVSEGKRSGFHRDLAFAYGRKARYFLRDTGEMNLPFIIRNNGAAPFEQVMLDVEFVPFNANPNAASPAKPLVADLHRVIEKIAPGEEQVANFPLDTRLLRSDEYMIRARLSLPREGLSRSEIIYIGIARNWNPERFNYFTWDGAGGGKEEERQEYASRGFTMSFGGPGRAQKLDWEHNGLPIPEEAEAKKISSAKKEALFSSYDLALKYGIVFGPNLLSWHGKFWPEELYGKTADGKKTGTVLPRNPRFREFSLNFIKTAVESLRDYQAFRLLNINTESEHHNEPDFSPLGMQLAKEECGIEPKPLYAKMYGFPTENLPGLAENGVVDETNEAYRFYRWYWLKGEGFNLLAKDMADAARAVKPDLFLFHEPCERMAFVRDRHQGLNPWDWTYTAPNALTLPYKIEVLRAIGKKSGYSQVCNYVQVLWKKWVIGDEDFCPSASIIRLGLLHSASRPVKAVGHWNAGWMREHAHLDRWEGVKRLHEEIWQPDGAVLMAASEMPRRKVAFLVSYTNSLFSKAYANKKWCMEAAYSAWHEAFLRAGLPVDVVFEEDVAEGALANYQALFIPFCEVLGKSAHEKIVSFAEAGGQVVADNNLGFAVPNVKKFASSLDHMIYPNWAWMGVSKGGGVKVDERLAKMWETVKEISSVFAPFIAENAVASDPWLIVTERRGQGQRFIYAVNDKRIAGEIGRKFGTIVELGAPLTATVRVPGAANIKAVYDLIRHESVPFQREGEAISWSYDYAPASAGLFALLEEPIDSLSVAAPEQAEIGGAFDISVRILGENGQPVKGLTPVEFILRDANGAVSEYSDNFAARDGEWKKTVWLATNDSEGIWSATVRELASGKTSRAYVAVRQKAE